MTKNLHDNLIHLINMALQQDALLREKYQVGDRFVFVRSRLQSLLTELQNAQFDSTIIQKNEFNIEKNTPCSMVYVYLYNAQGLQLKSWLALLTQKALYEHSVNRPIFFDKNEIESLLKSKSNIAQHAYLVISVVHENISAVPSTVEGTKTSLIRVREGSLLVERIVSLVHNGVEYTLDSHGQLIKKV